MSESHENKKVIVIGLDGSTWDVLKPWMEEGKLPTLQWLTENGVSGNLETVIPSLSAPAWVSFSTGKKPGNHGIYNFILKKDNSYDVTFMNNSIQRKLSKRVWDYLDSNGLKSIIMNLMPTYPLDTINGVLIADKLTTPSNRNFIYPSEVAEELRSEVGEYDIEPLEDLVVGSDSGKFFDRLYRSEEQQINYLKYLLENHSWDLAISVFSGSDCVQHAFWNCLDPNHPFYNANDATEGENKVLSLSKLYDDFLDYLVKKHNDALILIVSDHGHGPCYKYFNLPSWLKKKGYLKFKKKPITQIKLLLFSKFFDTAYNLMGKLGIVEKVKHFFLRGKSSDGKSLFDYIFISWKDIDWNKTTAFTISSGGQIYINLKDREPEGSISSEEYEEVREKLIDELEDLVDPETGERVMYKVYKKEEIYQGKYSKNAPDLVCLPNKGYVIQYPQVYKPNLFEMSKVAGSHASANELNGIFIAYGNEVKNGGRANARLYDIIPTLLHVLGIPIAEDMDGRVIKEIFSSDSYLAKKEVERVVKKRELPNDRTKVVESVSELKRLGKI